MDKLNRQELLRALSTMGVEIPLESKLSDDALDRRLRQSLNAAQSFSPLIPDPPVNISALPQWPMDSRVEEASARGNFEDALRNSAARQQGRDPAGDLFIYPFKDLRRTLMWLAKQCDEDRKSIVIQDPKKEESAINIRILGVYKLNDETPLILLIYQSVTKANPHPGVRWMTEQINSLPCRDGFVQIPNISATDVEQKLLLKLLTMNAKHIPADFKPSKTETEQDFQTSFLLPLDPLSFEELGKLNVDTGCAVCGKKMASRCSRCQSVSYCGTDCQRIDWPSHKRTCHSIKGGTWHTILVSGTLPGLEGHYLTTVNRHGHTTSSDPLSRVRHGEQTMPQPNIHDSKVFLVKVQWGRALGLHEPLPDSLFFYDRQRSFEFYFARNAENNAVFDQFRKEMTGPRGPRSGVKIYRWARRVSDWELSVCLDIQPALEAIMW